MFPVARTWWVLLLSLSACGRGATSTDELAGNLREPDEATRIAAADALGRRGADAASAVPALCAALTDGSARVRSSALIALGKMGPSASTAVPAIAPFLNVPDSLLRRQACQALGQIGSLDPGTRSALERAARDSAPIVRDAAKEALERLNRQ